MSDVIMKWMFTMEKHSEIDEISTCGKIKPIVIFFHYFKQHSDKLIKWIELKNILEVEYTGRITFRLTDISEISDFNSSITAFDFGNFRAAVAPRVYAVNSDRKQYVMHMMINLKYMRDFCEKLLSPEQLFGAVEVMPTNELPARNFYELCENHCAKTMLVVFYNPAGHLWQNGIHQGILRKLATVLIDESIVIVAVSKSDNYLSVDLALSSAMKSFDDTAWFDKTRSFQFSGDHLICSHVISTRKYLQFIASKNLIELQKYDRNGEEQNVNDALLDLRYIL